MESWYGGNSEIWRGLSLRKSVEASYCNGSSHSLSNHANAGNLRARHHFVCVRLFSFLGQRSLGGNRRKWLGRREELQSPVRIFQAGTA
jgi:hypothetical protein